MGFGMGNYRLSMSKIIFRIGYKNFIKLLGDNYGV